MVVRFHLNAFQSYKQYINIISYWILQRKCIDIKECAMFSIFALFVKKMRTVVISCLLWMRRTYAYILHRNARRAHPWVQTKNYQVLVPGLQLFIGEEGSWLQLAEKSQKVCSHAIRNHSIIWFVEMLSMLKHATWLVENNIGLIRNCSSYTWVQSVIQLLPTNDPWAWRRSGRVYGHYSLPPRT